MAQAPIERGWAHDHPWRMTLVVVAIVPLSGLPVLLGAAPDPQLGLVARFAGAAYAVALLSGLGWWGRCGFVVAPTAHDLSLAGPLLLVTGAMAVVGWIGSSSPTTAVLVPAVIGTALTAFAEEALNRGVLLESYRPFGPVRAVVGAAAVFAAMHASGLLLGIPPGDVLFLMLVTALPAGLAFGALRLGMSSIWPLVAIHLLNNLAATAAAEGVVDPSAQPERWALLAGLQVGLLALLLGYSVVLLWRLGRTARHPAPVDEHGA